MEPYTAISLEIHLFFLRIMREHALFLEAGFPCQNEDWIRRADRFREEFEKLLAETVEISSGRVSGELLASGEIVTEFTFPAERATERLSGVPIDSGITRMEHRLEPWNEDGRHEANRKADRREAECRNRRREDLWEDRMALRRKVHRINERALRLLNGLIPFKESILREVTDGRLFTANYPMLIRHIIREAKLYRDLVREVMRNGRISRKTLQDMEVFWNQIMMEHALFIRGLLDPGEEELVDTADGFADEYRELLELAKQRDRIACGELTERTLAETVKYRDFKEAATQGILDLKIESVILPLLADHVLREANHYIRILESGYCGGEVE